MDAAPRLSDSPTLYSAAVEVAPPSASQPARPLLPRRRAEHPRRVAPTVGPTSPPRVHLAGSFPAREELAAKFELVATPVGAEAVVAFRTTRLDATYMDLAGSGLRLIANFGVGYDNIDIDAARARGIAVTTTPDVSTGDVAQLALAATLDLMRHIGRGDRLVRAGHPRAFEPGFVLGRSLIGASIGIVGGRGRIGTELARLLSSLHAIPVCVGRGELGAVIGKVDVLILLCPLNDTTWHLIDASVLSRLGRGTFIVNVARGAVIDEAALAVALETGLIAGAALDVFEFEPTVSERLRALDNVLLTPHLGAATIEARAAKAAAVCHNLQAVLLHGQEPIGRIC